MADRMDFEAAPEFTFPSRQILLMIIVIGLVGVGVWFVQDMLMAIVMANLYLNGFILAVFAVGVLTCFTQLFQLVSSTRWLKAFSSGTDAGSADNAPRLLASMAALLRTRGRMQISATSSRSILDSVATRIDEARDITRYIVNLLIFLGLLGTFYGLATTVPAVVETIRSLAPKDGETSVDIFTRLMGGLEAQLGGMGTAFASSLLGLAGSLVVGLLELFASHGQNRFYRELEDWLSTITRLGFAGADVDGPGAEYAVAGAITQMVDTMGDLQGLFEQADAARAGMEDRLSGLAAAVEGLARSLNHSHGRDMAALERIADGQERLIKTMQGKGGTDDAEARMRLRSIDVQLLRILEEMSAGRQETLTDIRTSLANLSKGIGPGAQGRE
jgi:hypothetical protein